MAIGVSLFTVILFFVKVTPNSIVNSDTFISTLTAFIGISVTLLIGYQVYNAVEIKQELAKIDEIKQEIDTTRDDLDAQKKEVEKQRKSLKNEMELVRCVCLSRAAIVEDPLLSFVRLHEALQFILSSDEIKENLGWYKEELCERMAHIGEEDFGLDVPAGILGFRKEYKDDAERIRRHTNYIIVKEWYEEMMRRFEKILDNIVKEVTAEGGELDSSYGFPDN